MRSNVACLGGRWLLLAVLFLASNAESCGEEILSGFLQVSVNMEAVNATAVPQLHPRWKVMNQENHGGQGNHEQVAYQPETVTPLLYFIGQLSRAVVILLYFCLLMMVLAWLLCGLPQKAPQDERVKDDVCPRTWLMFLCSTYGFVYFSTDQYAPNLPQMGVDLSGSQWLMSASVQFNFLTKALMGLVIAGISDQVGRRPVMVTCLSLLAMASFGCGCAPNAGWFVASRFLQGLGESVEPVVFATCRDYFAKPEDRMMVITAVQLVGSVAQMVAPIFGGFSSLVFGWRFSFFCLALLWGSYAAYAARYMLESCPDTSEEKEEGGTFFGLRKILKPGPLCLLFTEVCTVVPFLVFASNIGYVTQVNYGQSRIATSFCMLAWAVIDALGVIGTQCLQSFSGLSILQVSRMMMVTFAITGIFSLFLGRFSEHMWSYLTASFLQGMLYSPALVLLNVLYFEPLEDCAGLASAFEILAQDFLPNLYSMVCTQSLVHSGVRSYMLLQSVSFVAAPVFYLGYELVQRVPSLPPVAHESDVYKDPDRAG